MTRSPAPLRRRFFAALHARPVTAAMMLLLVCVLGAVAYTRIPLTLFPEGISEPEVTIFAQWPDASPHEVLEKVTDPLEEAVRTLPRVRSIVSRSSADAARIRVTFDPETDMDLAYQELSDRIERTRPSLPDDVREIRVWRMNLDQEMPILWLGILYDDDVEDPFATVDQLIQPRLEAVDGVAQVSVWGMVEDSVRIQVRPEALAAHGVSFYELATALRRDNFALPAGLVEDGGRRYALRVDARFADLEELRDWPVTPEVRLRDVADVFVARSWRDQVSRVNGKNSLTCVIQKESDENTVEACRRVQAALAELSSDPRLEGFSFRVYFDQSDLIVGALDNLKTSMGWGALFAVLVLYVFVRRAATTLLVALAIPTSLLAALVGVYFTGHAFNLLSLAGFTLAIGMLVDNSVVVAENVARHRALGLPPFEAAVRGASEVGLAVLLATLTTIAVFAPVVFMAPGRNLRIFLGELATPIAFSLAASLVVALVLLPIATVHLVPRRPGRADGDARAYASGARALGRYRRMLSGILRHRFAATLATGLVVAGGMAAGERVTVKFDEGGEGERLRVQVDLPTRFTLEEASDVFGSIESFLLERKDDYRFRDVSVRFDRTGGRVFLWFDSNDPERPELARLAERLREELPRMPGVFYRVGYQRNEEGSVRIRLEGPDPETLARIGEELARRLERLPELTAVETDLERGEDELRIRIDRDRVERFGVSPEVLQGIVAWGVGGQRLADLERPGRSLPVLLEYEEPEDELGRLRALDVPVGAGASVPLGAVTRLEFRRSFGSIRREDGRTSLLLHAESLDEDSYRVQRRVEEVLRSYPFPKGYGWRDASDRREWEEGMRELWIGLVTGVVFVFLLMGMLFESAILPLSVLLAVPLAMVGANVALWITGTPLDATARLAFILLAGVVVNNGIVLVDRIRQIRDEGFPRLEALLEGCSQRLRPVLMTALTTMFGLLPMALPQWFASDAPTGLNYRSLAVATLGGLALSTLLTLFVVPLFYTLFDDLGALLRQALLLAPPTGTPDPEEAGA